jgi:hypothetical protein
MFIGKMDLGFNGLFTITTVRREGFYDRSAYTVEYRLFDQLDNTLRDNLTLKTVENKYFDKIRLLSGRSPLISYAAANASVGYKQALENVLDILYQSFYDERMQTFIYPHNDSVTVYDPWAVNFFNQVIPRKYINKYSMPKEYSIGVADVNKKATLWRAIVNVNGHGLDYLYPRVFNLVSASRLGTLYIQNTIAHAPVDYVPMPDKFTPGFTVPAGAETYVFTEAFYDKDLENATALEKAVLTVIDGKVPTDGVIDSLLDTLKTLSGKDLFYASVLMASILTIRITEG